MPLLLPTTTTTTTTKKLMQSNIEIRERLASPCRFTENKKGADEKSRAKQLAELACLMMAFFSKTTETGKNLSGTGSTFLLSLLFNDRRNKWGNRILKIHSGGGSWNRQRNPRLPEIGEVFAEFFRYHFWMMDHFLLYSLFECFALHSALSDMSFISSGIAIPSLKNKKERERMLAVG